MSFLEIWQRVVDFVWGGGVNGPGLRLFLINFISAIALSGLYIGWVFWGIARGTHKNSIMGVRSDRSKSVARRVMNALGLRRKLWFNRSVKVDVGVIAINALVKAFILAPFVGLTYLFSKVLFHGLVFVLGPAIKLEPTYTALLVFTAVIYVFDDFTRFYSHYILHSRWLWPFHSVHHSARVMVLITRFRMHPVEIGLGFFRGVISNAFALSAFYYFFDGRFTVISFLGVNMIGEIFHLMSVLRHSQLPLSYGIFEKLFVSPAQHQIHHSIYRHEMSLNYGIGLALWDQLWGTLAYSKEYADRLQTGKFRFGIPGVSAHSFRQALVVPFYDFVKVFQKQMRGSGIPPKPATTQNEVTVKAKVGS